MFSSNEFSARVFAAVSSLAISALVFAFAIAPAVPSATGTGMLV